MKNLYFDKLVKEAVKELLQEQRFITTNDQSVNRNVTNMIGGGKDNAMNNAMHHGMNHGNDNAMHRGMNHGNDNAMNRGNDNGANSIAIYLILFVLLTYRKNKLNIVEIGNIRIHFRIVVPLLAILIAML